MTQSQKLKNHSYSWHPVMVKFRMSDKPKQIVDKLYKGIEPFSPKNTIVYQNHTVNADAKIQGIRKNIKY